MNDKDIKSIAKNRDMHPNSLKALEQHQYKKGESGNTGGRPVKYYKFSKSLAKVRDKVIRQMQEVDRLEGISTREYKEIEIGKNRELVIDKIWELARGGDKQMILLLVEMGALNE